MRIVIVVESPLTAQRLDNALASTPHKIQQAANTIDALRVLRTSPIDAAIIDGTLPLAERESLIGDLRTLPGGSDITVVILGDAGQPVPAPPDSRTVYLAQPFSDEDLVLAITSRHPPGSSADRTHPTAKSSIAALTALSDGATVTLDAGDILFSRGDQALHAYVLLAGRLDIFIDRSGVREKLAEAHPDQLIGETAVIAGAKRSTHAVAATRCELAVISREALERYLAAQDSPVKDWIQSLSTEVASLSAQLADTLPISRTSTEETLPRTEITYRLLFPEGVETMHFSFDPATWALNSSDEIAPPDWARLEHHQCEHCPLDPATSPYCPHAKALAPYVARFGAMTSHHEIVVEVRTANRTIVATKPMQHIATSIFGLLGATSGCPHLTFFRPLARFHVPFADEKETLHRSLSLFLQYSWFSGQTVDMAHLATIMTDITKVTDGLSVRLRAACKRDAVPNAIIILNCFSMTVPWAIDDQFNELTDLFTQYQHGPPEIRPVGS